MFDFYLNKIEPKRKQNFGFGFWILEFRLTFIVFNFEIAKFIYFEMGKRLNHKIMTRNTKKTFYTQIELKHNLNKCSGFLTFLARCRYRPITVPLLFCYNI